MKKNVKKNHIYDKSEEYSNQKSTIATAHPSFTFLEIHCPYCDEIIVCPNDKIDVCIICTNGACRKVMHIENFKEIA